MTLIEEIKMISDFMGFEGQHEEWCGNNILINDDFSDTGKNMVPYNPDKNWYDLMPVVERLEEPEVNDDKLIRSGINIEIYYKACRLEFVPDEDFEDIEDCIFHTQGETKIEAVYRAVVLFIKWYIYDKH
jgi:hypothetical protein